MSSIDLAVRATRDLESALERGFGATGKGLHEKIDSVEGALPDDVVKTLRWIATLRNNVVHREGFELDDPDGFRSSVERVSEELAKLAPVRSAGAGSFEADRADVGRGSAKGRARAAMICAGVAGLALLYGIARTGLALSDAFERAGGGEIGAAQKAELLSAGISSAMQSTSLGLAIALLAGVAAVVLKRQRRADRI
jgi:hypothetical protein